MPRKKTQEEFIKEVYDRYGDEYTVLGIYKTNHTPIKLKHNKCGNIWDTTAPYDFLKSKPNTCPKCSHPSRRKSHQQFIQEVKNLVGDEYTVLGTYETTKTHILMKCNKCGKEYEVRPGLFLQGSRCPDSKCRGRESKGEKKIRQILEDNNINFSQEFPIFDEKTKRADQQLRIDFYIEELKLGIEYDGEQHFHPWMGREDELIKTQKRDLRKNIYCRDNNIDLLRIGYFDFKKIKKILIDKFNKYNIVLK